MSFLGSNAKKKKKKRFARMTHPSWSFSVKALDYDFFTIPSK